MKEKTYRRLLGIEAAVLLVLCSLQQWCSGWFAAVSAFPFEQIGFVLRKLSLHSVLGNASAIVLYAAVSLLPVLAMVLICRRRRLQPEDWGLLLISGALFYVLYRMINPGSMPELWRVSETAAKAVLGGVVYSLLIGYVVLRLLRSFSESDAGQLQKNLCVLLRLLGVFFVAQSTAGCLSQVFASIRQVQAQNTVGDLQVTVAFLVLRGIVDALPYVLDTAIVLAALRLARVERHSAEAVEAAEGLSIRCCRMLAITVVSNGCFNLLQVLAARRLLVVDSVILLPLFSVLFALAMLLVACLMRENKQLKDDNDLFV